MVSDDASTNPAAAVAVVASRLFGTQITSDALVRPGQAIHRSKSHYAPPAKIRLEATSLADGEAGLDFGGVLQVSFLNGSIILHAERQIYARDDQFPHIMQIRCACGGQSSTTLSGLWSWMTASCRMLNEGRYPADVRTLLHLELVNVLNQTVNYRLDEFRIVSRAIGKITRLNRLPNLCCAGLLCRAMLHWTSCN
jgi:hypothetical protein